MKDEIKEILETLKNNNCYSNFIDDINGGNEYYYLLEKSEGNLLLDYITNLQEENEKLKQPQIFIDTMDMEERYGQELYEDYLKEQLENYKQRNEKAIKYIEYMEYLTAGERDELYDILKGEDK